MKLFFTTIFALVTISNVAAQELGMSPQNVFFDTQKVVPSNYAAAAGANSFDGPFSSGQMTYQLIIAASELSALVGKNLISISFRNPVNAISTWPPSDITLINYDIYLGNAVNPADRTLFFAQNAVGLPMQVRSGNLVVPANALTIGSNPNNFSYDIDFTTPYLYSGGNLLVEIRHFGTQGSFRRVDAVDTTVPGYGTLFSASWYPSNTTSINSAFEDSFSVVNFKATDVLSTMRFESNETTVFPNPTRGNLTIESNAKIKSIKILNLLGQTIEVKELRQDNFHLDLSQYSNGTYLLTIENEFGTVTKKVFKN
jgi:hypothetical protein